MNATVTTDRPTWQRFHNNAWQSYGDDSSIIESAFCSSSNDGSTSVADYNIDFSLMACVDHNQNLPIRRLSSKEAPDVFYEWEEYFGNGNSIWTPHNTDDCEAINISHRAGRRKITIYVGTFNTPWEINFAANNQLNLVTQQMRWMRKVPPVVFAASPSSVLPSNLNPASEVLKME